MTMHSVRYWENHYAVLRRKPVSLDCPACCDLGWVGQDLHPGDPEFGQLTRCPTCGKGRQRDWLYDGSGLMKAEQSLSLKDWRIPAGSPSLRDQRVRAAQVIEKVVASRTGFVTFWGDFGSGKSMCLRIIVNECIQANTESFYAPFSLILDHLRDMYARKERTSSFWERVLAVPVLALDEVTRYNATEWAQQQLWVLSDLRYRRRASHLTAFGMNDDPNQNLPTTETIGYLYSRMREGTLVELRGDMRPAFKGE